MRRIQRFGAIGLLLLLGCEQETITDTAALIELEPTEVELLNVPIGLRRTVEAEVFNRGDGLLELDALGRTGLPEGLSAELSRTSVPPGESATLTVTFFPVEIGEVSGVIDVRATDESVQARTLDVRATAVETPLGVEPDILDFGKVLVGAELELELELTGRSSEVLEPRFTFDAYVESCPSRTTAFCVDDRSPPFDAGGRLVLQPGATAKVVVRFTPLLADIPEAAELEVRACADCLPETVSLRGTGVDQALACAPAALDFGATNPTTCLTRSVTCTNVASAPANLFGWQLAANSSRDFLLPGPVRATSLAPGDSEELEVQYCPPELGEDTGSLQIEGEASRPQARIIEVALLGQGGGPIVEVAPQRLSFGDVATLVPAQLPLLISNSGFDDLTVERLEIVGADPTEFSVDLAPTVIAPGASLRVDVEFAPTAAVAYEALLQVRSDSPGREVVDVPLGGTGVVVPPCNYELAPTSLGFGIVEPGRSQRRAVQLRNVGGADCLIYGAALSAGTDDAFSLLTTPERTLAAGASLSLVVEYAPLTAATHAGSLELSLSAAGSPLQVTLTGNSADTDLIVVPRAIDFGSVGVGCGSRQRSVRLYNEGATALTLSGVQPTPSGAPFVVQNVSDALPHSLAGGASAGFDVRFTPTREGGFAGAVEIEYSTASGPETQFVSLTGEGANMPQQVDRFSQLGVPKADILFVVDNSCSMQDEQNSLSGNFASFMQYANREAVDYRIAVITLDNAIAGFGLFQPLSGPAAAQIVTPQTSPSPVQAFQTLVNVGAVGPGPEMGFEAAYTALSNPLISTAHSHFLRSDAFLSLIVVSDQPDLSARSNDFFYNFFLSIKGARDPGAFTLSAIVGDAPSGCQGPGGGAQAGPRYIDMATRTGGVVESICSSNWAQSLEALSQTAFGFRNSFFLTGQPDLVSLVVRVDGVVVPERNGQAVNWSYEPASNTIAFGPFSAPEPGSQIEVRYTPVCL